MNTPDLRAPIRVAVAEECPECGTTERWSEPATNQLVCRACPYTEPTPPEGEPCEHRWLPDTGVDGVPAQCLWCCHVTWTDEQKASS